VLAYPLIALGVGVAAAAIGAVAVLTRGFYFIMVTLAFGEMAYALFHDTRIAGGSDGAYINVKPVLDVGGAVLLDLDQRAQLLYVALALLVCGTVALGAFVRSRTGGVLQAVRRNETRVAALGFNPYAYKLLAFAIAGGLAGLAGALFATIDGYVTPDLFGWKRSGLAIMMVVLGGTGTLFGPILGAVVFTGLEEVLKSADLVGPLAQHWSLALGVILVALVLAAPRGMAGLFARSVAEPPEGAATARPEAAARAAEPRLAPALEVADLARCFGGLAAVDGVTLRFEPNKVHAIIGPNGAGKTTLINLLSGALRPSAGTIRLDGADITGWPPYRMARHGIGRSYQITNVVRPFTALENCCLAAQASPSPRGGAAVRHRGIALTALAAAGLAERAEVRADALSHGEQRQLEIAMLLASGARVLLLDEPLAGMGPEETQRVTALVRSLARDHTVILIEHDLDAVFAVADTLTVMDRGRVLAHGDPRAVRTDPAVRAAYLGDDAPTRPPQ
jgi:branched-chain amino acid transport system permease protein